MAPIRLAALLSADLMIYCERYCERAVRVYRLDVAVEKVLAGHNITHQMVSAAGPNVTALHHVALKTPLETPFFPDMLVLIQAERDQAPPCPARPINKSPPR